MLVHCASPNMPNKALITRINIAHTLPHLLHVLWRRQMWCGQNTPKDPLQGQGETIKWVRRGNTRRLDKVLTSKMVMPYVA